MRAYLAEVHALHSFATQRRTNRRRGRRLARADDQLDDLVFLDRFLGHGVGFVMVATPSLGPFGGPQSRVEKSVESWRT